jgi:serine phosphatase RsbU (regulator of sigma subunit)
MTDGSRRPLFGDHRISYAFFGALFGLCFPVISTVFDVAVQGIPLSWQSLMDAQRNQPLHWVIDTAPLFLGLFAYVAGRKQHEVVLVNEGLEDQVRERTVRLSAQNEELKTLHSELEVSLERISQSINYAQRIQDAIVSDMRQLKQGFNNCSMLFKPRDVVSGDFPWYLNHGGRHYFAAVDCTGHGVPGAFMSLIGYFLLNRIVKDQGVQDAGEILCNLHMSVVNLLNQQEDTTMHDGMDIALCIVDESRKEVQFSGACNPLYHVSGDSLNILKADVWSIGGVHYKKRCPYTTQRFNYAEGDVLAMFTDGITDQFDKHGKSKFGYAPIKRVVTDPGSGPVTSWAYGLEQELTEFMGDHRQMDDMLFMAVQL